MSDNELRDRIERVIAAELDRVDVFTVADIAQAVIDDLGLTVDSHFEHKAGSAIEMNETQAEYDERVKPRTFHRVVGKWEKQ